MVAVSDSFMAFNLQDGGAIHMLTVKVGGMGQNWGGLCPCLSKPKTVTGHFRPGWKEQNIKHRSCQPSDVNKNDKRNWAKKRLTTSALWRHGSVVEMSVSGWRTFPDLCLIYGW